MDCLPLPTLPLTYAAMLRAVRHVRRMRGGSQPQLLRCREGSGGDGYYVVKFLENPQHRRVLANEWVASRLASLLGRPVPRTEVIEVRADLLEFEAELDQLYKRHVAPPPRRTGRAEIEYEIGRASIRLRLSELFRRAGLAGRLERGVRVEELTFEGDPLRLDFAYRRDGTRGFVQALSLHRDAAQAKALAYTAGLVRKRLGSAEFTVVSESVPSSNNARDQFVVRLLSNEQIGLVPVTELEPWVDRLRSELLQ